MHKREQKQPWQQFCGRYARIECSFLFSSVLFLFLVVFIGCDTTSRPWRLMRRKLNVDRAPPMIYKWIAGESYPFNLVQTNTLGGGHSQWYCWVYERILTETIIPISVNSSIYSYLIDRYSKYTEKYNTHTHTSYCTSCVRRFPFNNEIRAHTQRTLPSKHFY